MAVLGWWSVSYERGNPVGFAAPNPANSERASLPILRESELSEREIFIINKVPTEPPADSERESELYP